MIEIKNISFAYKKEHVLKHISTRINQGDFVAFVGPNGSGKSTLIRCIVGILKPQQGNIHIKGKDLLTFNRNALARIIAYVPQSEGEKLSTLVYDTVLMGRKPYIAWKPNSKDHAVVIRALKTLGIESLAMRNVSELSGGQKQRVFIARALAQEPDILLLDEPTANLDLKHSLDVLGILKKLTENNITVIIAIHDLNLAIRYCNHITMLNNGEIFAEGGKNILTTDNIYKLYGVDMKVIKDGSHMLFVPN